MRVDLHRVSTAKQGEVHFAADCGCLVVLKIDDEAHLELCEAHSGDPFAEANGRETAKGNHDHS